MYSEPRKANFFLFFHWALCWVDVWLGHHLPRSFQYHTMQQEERRNKTKEKQSKYVDQPQKGSSPRDMQISLWKKNFTLNPCTPNSLSPEVPLTKTLFLLKTHPEPLKCLATAVQEPPAPSLTAPHASLSSRFVRLRETKPPILLYCVSGLLKA